MPILISLSGLPGVGKTTLAKALAVDVSAVHLRVDTVEAALKTSTLGVMDAEDAGYLAIASLAIDNLLLGLDVIVDTVNPVERTRELWSETAAAGKARLLNVEVLCSNKVLHRERVEARTSDKPGLMVPDWHQVESRCFEPWTEDRMILDTSIDRIEICAAEVAREMERLKSIDS